MSATELTVILPTLNEEGNISPLISAIKSSVPLAQIIVVDDSSQDKTAQMVAKIQQQDPSITLIQRTEKPCLRLSLQEGIDTSKTSYIAWMDADFSHPPELLPELLKAAKDTGCAIASRFLEGGASKQVDDSGKESIYAVILSKVLNFLMKKWLKINVTDYTSGFIVCHSDYLKNHPLVGDYGEYFIELVYHLTHSGVTIKELPYISPARQWGESKTGNNLLKLTRRGVKYLWLTLCLKIPSLQTLSQKAWFGKVCPSRT